jgi:L-alanine-DL-glutamate epimerase-like enolase superfamily enzyme
LALPALATAVQGARHPRLFITLPDRAGIGVEMDEAVARKAQVANTPWFEAGL